MNVLILKEALIQNIPILIHGETGTGKSTLAKKIVSEVFYGQKNCIHVNLSSLNFGVFESELFGHVKGAFTGAIATKSGLLDRANDHVLFIDEIGELEMSQQVKLLQLIEERVYYPVGSTTAKRFEGCFIFATHRNLHQLVTENKFREDLYFRLKGCQYTCRPLRLSQDKIKGELNKLSHLNEKEVNLLMSYKWPGNYRELAHFVSVASLFDHKLLGQKFVEQWVGVCEQTDNQVLGDHFHQAIERFERKFLEDKLKKFKGMINRTSSEINLSKSTLIAKIRKYDINVASFKDVKNYKYLQALS